MKTLRIGTRNSPLALWQAENVQAQLEALGYSTVLVPITSTGDIVLDKPLYELGITGIFTKTLDVALLQDQIDIAVHSMKDVPTALPFGIVQTAVLERASVEDVLILKDTFNSEKENTIATGSLRRKAQWLNRFPHHKVVGLRGNVNTRLKHLQDNAWEGAVFAKAGLERIDLLPAKHISLDWMVPAPAQGAMVIVAKETDPFSIEATSKLNHETSACSTHIERQFLRILEGGCTAPIGAYAKIKDNKIYFTGILLSLDGSQKIEVSDQFELDRWEDLGKRCAEQLLSQGGRALMAKIKNELES